jgi:WD40 repeat protein
VLAASGLIGLFALAALWMGAEARHRAEDARTAQHIAETNAANAYASGKLLWEFSLHSARAERLSRQTGQRSQSLRFIREAVRFQPSRELRDEALSALLLPDMGTTIVWHEEAGFEVAGAYEPNLQHFIQNCDHGRAIVRRTADGATVMDQEGFGPTTTFWQFSPDGQLAAIAYREGPVGVWDWQRTNLVARFPTIHAEWAEPPFDFAPSGRQLWLLTTNQSLASCDLGTQRPTVEIPLEHPARFVRLSPSGKLAAVASGNLLDVWDLPSRTRRATLTLANDIWRLAWQPGEERLAIGCERGLLLWNIGAPQPVTLRADDTVTVVFFTPDGDQLFAAGWTFPGELWNTRDRQVVLQFAKVAPLQLSVNQTRLSVSADRVGYGVRRFLPPVGIRLWPVPVSFAGDHRAADVDPRGRWLLTAHTAGWLIRDAESGRELAHALCGKALAVCFGADSGNVFAWTGGGLQRWPLAEEPDSGKLRLGPAESVWSATNGPPDLAVFAADRRHTSCSQAGRVTVLALGNAGKTVQFPLHWPGDNCHFLSPDGRWVLTALHNQEGLDWYDCQTGQWVRRIVNEGFAVPVFDPEQGRLFTCTASDYSEWAPETGERLRTVSWREPAPFQTFLGFAPGGRLALVKSSSSPARWR